MTISTQQSSQTFLGNDITTAFDFVFVGAAADFINVTYTDASGTLTTLSPSQYTIFLNSPTVGALWGIGGTVTYPTTGSPIASGTSITISRILPLVQDDSISNQGAFAPQVTEIALDTLEMQLQQVASRTGQYRGTWITNTLYSYGDTVQDGVNGADTGNIYMCVIANTSSTWAADLAAGYWTLAIDVNILGPISSISGTANRITVTNPTTTPVIDIASTYVGQTSITTLGDIATGTWNGTTITVEYGGTGVTSLTSLAAALLPLLIPSYFPIGSYYMNETVATNPATLFGFGTWTAVTDKFIVAHGTTYTATGGAATVTLAQNNLPASMSMSAASGVGDAASSVQVASANSGSTHQTNIALTNAGGGQAFSIIPTYQAAYIWKRTA